MDYKREIGKAVKWCSFFASVAFLALTGCTESTDEYDNSPIRIHADPPRPGAEHFGGGQKAASAPPAQHRGACAPPTSDTHRQRFLMLVSTLDGRMTALDAESGEQEWSINTGSGTLLSSSISKLEINRDGVATHLIPSLDGGLYQFDGEAIEPVPLAADILLSSSFRFNDDSMVVGGKETENYGIDVKTGKVRYVCTMKGCKYKDLDDNEPKTASRRMSTDDPFDGSDEVLVISRHTKTVRAIEMRTGAEKWNFSVGQHEVSFISQAQRDIQHPSITAEPRQKEGLEEEWEESAEDVTEDSSFDQCHVEVEEDEEGDFQPNDNAWLPGNNHLHDNDIQLKVIVPSGLVMAFSKVNPSEILWQHKFDTAVADAWVLQNGALAQVSLFDAHHNLALGVDTSQKESDRGKETVEEEEDGEGAGDGPEVDEQMDEEKEEELELPAHPLLYVGMHEKQLYVQPSVQMLHDVEQATAEVLNRGTTSIRMPKVRWKPYLATAASRTPAVMVDRPQQIDWEHKPEDMSEEPEEAEGGDKKLTLWQNQYPYDNGYYLFPDKSPINLPNATAGKRSNHSSALQDTALYSSDITVSLLNWWREVLAISVVTSILVHLFLVKYLYKVKGLPCSESNIDTKSEEIVIDSNGTQNQNLAEKGQIANGVENKPAEYISRYQTDFEQIACLGKGGFGVVFQARNKLDDCDYALKRIALNNSDRAKEKVMREVKALAKLDHVGIVRYNQAWFESPPPGWQEEQDRHLVDHPSSTNTPGFTVTEYSPSNLSEHCEAKCQGKVTVSDYNPLKPFGGNLSMLENLAIGQGELTDISEGNEAETLGSSEGFTPHVKQNGLLEGEESGSYSFGVGSFGHSQQTEEEDSFDISFRNTDAEDTCSRSQDCHSEGRKLPFRVYNHSCLGRKQARCRGGGDDTNGSIDIIFEDSGCEEKSNPLDELQWDDMGHAIINISPDQSATQELGQGSNTNTSNGTVLSSSPVRPTSLGFIKETETENLPSPLASKLYLYIQMQMCRRENLKDWLCNNTLSRDRHQCLDIFHQIVSAVEYVHGNGLMHRDLKPSNIFFSMDGVVKVGDFGLVTAEEENCEGTPDERAGSRGRNFRHTDQVGTEMYMSPEQCSRKPYTQRVDIYALGLIFFELFYPFGTQMERVKTLLEIKKLLFPGRFVRELQDEHEFVKPMLSHDPDKRPSSVELLKSTLLVDFEEARQAYSRVRSNSRSRTLSNSSTSSSSG